MHDGNGSILGISSVPLSSGACSSVMTDSVMRLHFDFVAGRTLKRLFNALEYLEEKVMYLFFIRWQPRIKSTY